MNIFCNFCEATSKPKVLLCLQGFFFYIGKFFGNWEFTPSSFIKKMFFLLLFKYYYFGQDDLRSDENEALTHTVLCHPQNTIFMEQAAGGIGLYVNADKTEYVF